MSEEKLLEPIIMIIVREVSRFLHVDENLVAVYSVTDFEVDKFPAVSQSITVLLYSRTISDAGLEYVNQRAKDIGMAVKESASTDDGIDTLLRYYLNLFHQKNKPVQLEESSAALLPAVSRSVQSQIPRPIPKIKIKDLVRLMLGVAPNIKPKQVKQVMRLLGMEPSNSTAENYCYICRHDPIFVDGKNKDGTTVLPVVDRAWLEAVVRVTGVSIQGVEVGALPSVVLDESLVVRSSGVPVPVAVNEPEVLKLKPPMSASDMTLDALVSALIARVPNLPLSRQLRILAGRVDEAADAMVKLEIARELAAEAALLERDGVALLRRMFAE